MTDSSQNGPEFVFLIGAARSGTKFLRDLLASSAFVACIPFDINYVWRFRHESLPDDRIPAQYANEKVRQYVSRTLVRMAERSKGTSVPVVIEKSVSNVFRVPFIYELFPRARFIHMIRDGRDVTMSAARQWENPTDIGYLLDKLRYFPVHNVKYALWYTKNEIAHRLGIKHRLSIWGPRYPGIDRDAGKFSTIEIAAKQWSESLTAADQGLALIPDEQKITIHYEELVKDSRCLTTLLSFLNIPDPERVVASYHSVVERGKGGEWRKLPSEDRARVLPLIQRNLQKCGYTT